jgi:hypothetical protein
MENSLKVMREQNPYGKIRRITRGGGISITGVFDSDEEFEAYLADKGPEYYEIPA